LVVVRTTSDRLVVPLAVPLAVRRSLSGIRQGATDPCVRFAADGIWWARHTPAGPVTLHLDDRRADALRPGGVVTATAYGPGAADVLAGIDPLLGLHDTPEDLRTDHPVLAGIRRRQPGLRLPRTGQVLESLVPTILGQKVQTTAARRSWAALCRAHGEPAPGPVALRLPPRPQQLAALPYHAFHRFGLERRRADAVRRCAHAAHRLEGTISGSAATALAALRQLPGVGAWTAATVVGLSHGDADAVVLGDYHLPTMVAWALAGETGADDGRMLELLADYPGQRARVQTLVRCAGSRPPRRGPRLSLVDIRSW
jgi:3-methyladenine DNA glycosylase/8-oxoguanine DNA glycosylase